MTTWLLNDWVQTHSVSIGLVCLWFISVFIIRLFGRKNNFASNYFARFNVEVSYFSISLTTTRFLGAISLYANRLYRPLGFVYKWSSFFMILCLASISLVILVGAIRHVPFIVHVCLRAFQYLFQFLFLRVTSSSVVSPSVSIVSTNVTTSVVEASHQLLSPGTFLE